MHRTALPFILFLLSVLLAGACAPTPEIAAGDDIHLLPGRFAEEPVTTPLVAREAFIGPSEFYISYESDAGTIYSGGNWSNRIDLATLGQGTDGSYAGPYILPLEFHQEVRWPEVPEEPIVPRLLSSKYWNRFIDRVFESVLPKADMTGLVMHFDEDDYFLYYNDINNFESRLLTDKPENYVVAKTIDFMEFIRLAQPVMEEFLAEEGIEERRLVFSTGDAGAYSLPFIYIDRVIADRHIRSVLACTEGGGCREQGLASCAIGRSCGPKVIWAACCRVLCRRCIACFSLPRMLRSKRCSPAGLLRWNRSRFQRSVTARAWTWTSSNCNSTRLPGALQRVARLITWWMVRSFSSGSSMLSAQRQRQSISGPTSSTTTIMRRKSPSCCAGAPTRVSTPGYCWTDSARFSLPLQTMKVSRRTTRRPESVRQSLESDSEIDVRQSRNPWLVAGDHVKTTIVDEKIAFAGGMNIGREYRFVWHDLMMELRGPVVDELQNEFNKAWAHAGVLGDAGYALQRLKPNPSSAEQLGYPLRVLHTRSGIAEIFNAQRAAIRNARKFIYIQNAYLTDDAMLYELAKARRRGVDVRVILPLVGNHGPINKSNALAANAMLEHGIRVFVYPGMSHIKAAVFDGWACLGSANWDKLSFRTNKELNIATSHPEYVDELLNRVFYPDFDKSVELTEPFPERWSDHLMEIVADFVL